MPKDQAWLECITILLNEYDSILSNHKEDCILDKHRHPPDKEFIVESAWVSSQTYSSPQTYSSERKGEDENNNFNPEKIGTQYRYHLHLKSPQANRVGQSTHKPFIPISGLTEGNDWEHNDNTGEWWIPSMDLPEEIIAPIWIMLKHLWRMTLLLSSVRNQKIP